MSNKVAERFEVKFQRNQGGCWPWTAAKDRHGYGIYRAKRNGKWTMVRAHRFSYEHHVGPIPDGLDLHHKCENRACVNPDHLEPLARKAHMLAHPEGIPAAWTLKELPVGQKFGRLTILGPADPVTESDGKRRAHSHVRCDCGTELVASNKRMTTGLTKSCGCLRREVTAAKNKASSKHGHWSGGKASPAWVSWRAMVNRCTNRNDPHYCGDRFPLCDRWRESFENFLEDMGDKPVGYTLRRRNEGGGFSPDNCFWFTPCPAASSTAP